MSNENRTSLAITAEVLAGSGIGILVGFLLSLSIADVVGSFVGALAALLAAFLGLRGKTEKADIGKAPMAKNFHVWRTAGFGFACAATLVIGIVIRSHNVLGNSPADLVRTWTAAGYPEDLAHELVAYQELGILPEGWQSAGGESIPRPRHASVLFRASASSHCSELSARRKPDVAERLKSFKHTGGGWEVIAKVAEELEPEAQRKVLEAAWLMFCEG